MHLVTKDDNSFQSKIAFSDLKYPIQYTVPVVKLTNNYITKKERFQLSFICKHFFVNKNKYIEKNLTANLRAVAEKFTDLLEKEVREDFHEFLRVYTYILSRKIYLIIKMILITT